MQRAVISFVARRAGNGARSVTGSISSDIADRSARRIG